MVRPAPSPTPPAADPEPFVPGEQVGPFEIVAPLREGGMASLFLARRTGAEGFARTVAIKVVHPRLADDPVFGRMLVDEALLGATISHPNVVHVEELVESEGRCLLVMEYVHGCSLAQLVRVLRATKRRMTPELAVWVATEVADGLHAAHEARNEEGDSLGLVHRDISPHNVILAYQGHVKLVDFGIARARGQARLGASGPPEGTLRYMAPEQARGEPVDRRADVYALGVVLWELLTGRRLFRADDDAALLELVRQPRVAAPSSVAAGIPAAVETVVMRALAPRREDRQPTARAFRRQLAAAAPTSLAIDGSALASLLRTVMADELAKDEARLPRRPSQPGRPNSGRYGPPSSSRTPATSLPPLTALTTESELGDPPTQDDERPRGSSRSGRVGVADRAPASSAAPSSGRRPSAEPSSRPTGSSLSPMTEASAASARTRRAPPSPMRGFVMAAGVLLALGLGGALLAARTGAGPREPATSIDEGSYPVRRAVRRALEAYRTPSASPSPAPHRSGAAATSR